MSEFDRETSAGSEAHDEVVASPRFSARRKLFAAALVLGVVFALVLPVFSTLQPRYYGRYSDLRGRMDNWQHSTHARMSCISCHVNPGAQGFVSFAARSVPAFYSQLIQGPHPDNLLTVPDREACQKCHTAYRQVSPDGDLLIPHRAHVEVLDMNCAACHTDLVHTENAEGFNRPRMSTCLESCHDGVKASDKCVDCHTRKQAPKNHAEPQWLSEHSEMADKMDCGKCHDWTPDYCADCHKKRPASHVGNWKGGHSVQAKQRGDGCLVCHGGAAFCKKCH